MYSTNFTAKPCQGGRKPACVVGMDACRSVAALDSSARRCRAYRRGDSGCFCGQVEQMHVCRVGYNAWGEGHGTPLF